MDTHHPLPVLFGFDCFGYMGNHQSTHPALNLCRHRGHLHLCLLLLLGLESIVPQRRLGPTPPKPNNSDLGSWFPVPSFTADTKKITVHPAKITVCTFCRHRIKTNRTFAEKSGDDIISTTPKRIILPLTKRPLPPIRKNPPVPTRKDFFFVQTFCGLSQYPLLWYGIQCIFAQAFFF